MNVTSSARPMMMNRNLTSGAAAQQRTCGNTCKEEPAPQAQGESYIPSGESSKPTIGATEVQSMGGAVFCGAVGYLTHGPTGAAVGALIGLLLF